MTRHGFVALFIALAACTTSPSKDARTPAGTPNIPSFGLVKENAGGESWKGGSREAEEAGFLEDARAVAEVSSTLASGRVHPRVFHEKAHGCLTGKLKVFDADSVPAEFRRGLFAQSGREFELIARFSNGVGVSQHDALPDVRGIALKIFYDDTAGHPADLLMTNATNPFGRDQRQFIEFMLASPTVVGLLHADQFVKFLFNQEKKDPRELSYRPFFLKSVTKVIKDVAGLRYWSGHAYTYGPDTFAKFNIAPVKMDTAEEDRKAELENARRAERYGVDIGRLGDESVAQGLKSFFARRLADPNYLRARLAKRAVNEQITFNLYAQLWKDDRTTPVENTFIEWQEKDSPSVPVARITFDKQDFDSPSRDKECSRLRFSPGNFHPDHRPAGNMGRGRIFTYMQSQNSRGAKEAQPTSAIVTSWKRGDSEIGN